MNTCYLLYLILPQLLKIQKRASPLFLWNAIYVSCNPIEFFKIAQSAITAVRHAEMSVILTPHPILIRVITQRLICTIYTLYV